ncbi:hypothetical protein AB6N24_14295 [Cellulomonas sp. 179-A 4D5 NHS]|uniref:hypothetical protein n=1 Tax=Cellulomonas sp. 179-A 4D5 NHS TaxID=3142378 RepID=UPI00399F065E
MAGYDYSLFNRWRWGNSYLVRKKPLTLPDREALQALVDALPIGPGPAGGGHLRINEGTQTEFRTADDVLNGLPRSVWSLQMWVGGSSVELTATRGGRTAIFAPMNQPLLHALVSVFEQHGHSLSWRRHLHRFSRRPARGLTVLAPRPRDEQEDRRENRRIAAIGAASGFFGGVLGAAATIGAALLSR